MSGYGTRPTAGRIPIDDNRAALAQALLGIPGRIGGAFTGMSQQGLAANEAFLQGEGTDRPFWPSMDSGGRIGALASFINSNMAMGGPAGSLGAGPSMGSKARTVAAPMDEAFAIAQRNAARPVSEGGLGLPPNNTAADRAAAMGYDLPAFHGTGIDFTEFAANGGHGKTRGTGVFASESPSVASAYASGESPQVLPVYLRQVDNAAVDAAGANWNKLNKNTRVSTPAISTPAMTQADAALLAELEGLSAPASIGNKTVRARNTNLGRIFKGEMRYADDYASTDDIARWARDNGYGGLTVSNVIDRGPSGAFHTAEAGLPSNVHVVFDPRNIRSRFPAFDPARRNEADLLASYGPNPLAAALYAQPQE
jgi:hypothetical protein